ncbi:phosphate acyltransferase [Rubinisphaera italica]|uniref:Phosphate acetyltransferase n=1 Tax=Rubinisphaera italica TaxID=2527969 RepID=A0A5C5XDE2_9PLAN|nr:phosphate acyltransferase [Rubinisphaera italica]TWT61020.1 Phosphate acetyltransferase [Rubinisphaera italica]
MSNLPTFETLYERASQTESPIGVAAAGGADETVLTALHQAAAFGWVKPYVCGLENDIRSLCEQLKLDATQFEIVDSDSPAQSAVELIHQGHVSLMMKGQIATPDLMKAILNRETGLRTGRAIGQIVLMEIPRDEKVFLMTDTGISIRPTVDQKKDLMIQLIETAHKLGCSVPNIALMAATEKINEAMPETLEMPELIRFSQQEFPEQCHASGPLSFDLAYHAIAGSRKGIEDPVIGKADGMLFSDLLSANLTVKAIMYTAKCQFGGILCGTSVPVVFMSRADDVSTRLNSLAYALELVRNSPTASAT